MAPTKQKQKTAARNVPHDGGQSRSYGAFFERNWGKIFLFTLFFSVVFYAIYVTYTINATIRQATGGLESGLKDVDVKSIMAEVRNAMGDGNTPAPAAGGG
jgi:zona occludens toxin (predicted ATPase)